MPIIIDSVDDRVKLQLGDLLLTNIALQNDLDKARMRIAELEGPSEVAEVQKKAAK